MRGIYPVVATITAEGFERIDDVEIAERFRALLDRMTAPGSTTTTGTSPTMTTAPAAPGTHGGSAR